VYNTGMKNTHLEHLEDELLNEGYLGARRAFSVLRNLRKRLTGLGSSSTITVKYDGAPAVVCGTDPDNGMFFVGTKSVFNKKAPKICYSHKDIDFHYDGQLADKLHACLEHLPKLNIKGVLQGDLLFTDDKKVVSRGGARHWCFTPNTLTYTVGCDTDLGRQIAKASVGIVFHTSYYGPTFAAMHSKFGVDTSELVDCDDVFAHHAYHDDPFNLCYLSDTDLQKFDRLVSMAQVRVTGCKQVINEIAANKHKMYDICKPFFNAYIRSNEELPECTRAIHELKWYYATHFNKKIDSVKSTASKDKYIQMKDEGLSYIARNSSSIYLLIAAYKGIQEAKNMTVKSLGSVKTFHSFIKRGHHSYEPTPPEGFVAIQDGYAVKLVNRLEFSHANFSVEKNWSK
jgi:hypothetical protein